MSKNILAQAICKNNHEVIMRPINGIYSSDANFCRHCDTPIISFNEYISEEVK